MYDMTIRLQLNQEKKLYEQIYEHIRQEIRNGKLMTGERLPSTRSLAEYLQVARSTVDYAYDQLLSEGYIESKPYKGYFVCPMEGLMELEPIDPDARNNRKRSEDSEDAARIEKGSVQYHYDFSPHGIDMTGFPFSVWKKITKNILTDANSELFAQGEHQGDRDLRLTISRYLHSSRGVNCTPEQIIVGAGNDYLLMLLEKILGRHVPIAMENPTYKRAYQIFRSFAYRIITVDMDENGMQVSKLRETDARVAYVMPSHQYPTGNVMPIGRRMELLKWADEDADRYLIEDDYDSEFRYRGKPIPALQASDDRGKVIYIGTFSKAIAPAIRVSYMVLPKPLLEKYHLECDFYSCTVSRIDQRILNEFIRDGSFERHLHKMRKIYRGKHELLLEALKPFEKEFRITGEDGGLHLLLSALSDVSEQELIEKAAKQGVKVYGLSESMLDEPEEERHDVASPATVMLGYGALTPEQITEGVNRLKKGWLHL
jgi:GntR family transcriptional regulator/MocR family aminotransferase